MRELTKPLLLITVALGLPIVLLVLYGEMFVEQLQGWEQEPPAAWFLFTMVVLILASDIFLPVPSGPVMTLAGVSLGWIGGTIACWIGLTLGATLAFGLARRWGRPLAERYSDQESLASLEKTATCHGVWLLIGTRAMPLLAEACVLLLGMLQMRWKKFLITLSLSNLALALLFCVVGQWASENEWLPVVLSLSVAGPIFLTVLMRKALPSEKAKN